MNQASSFLTQMHSAGPQPAAHAIQILDSLNSGVIVASSDGAISFANQYASEILKHSKQTITEMTVSALLFPIETLLSPSGEKNQLRVRQEKKLTLHTGEEVVIGFHVSEVKDEDCDNSEKQYAVIFQDITKWNDVLQDRDRLLKIATVSDVLPTLLHELKNPLAAIFTAVEVLLEEVPVGETKDQLQAIFGEIRRMKLVFEGIGASHRVLQSTACLAVDEAIREVVAVLRAKARSCHISLVCEVEDMPPLPLDVSVVRAILFNLLNNAIEACDSGDQIMVSARRRLGETTAYDDALEISVSDTGCGMSDAAVEHCTELFVSSKASGSGIGLSLCKNTVESAGGELEIRSEARQGTTIRALIPLIFPKKRGAHADNS